SLRAPFGLLTRPGDDNPERLKVSGVLTPEGLPAGDVGDRWGSLEGVLDYDFGAFALLLFAPPAAPEAAARPAARTTLRGGPGALSVATYNVQNLDPRVEAR